MKKDLKEEGEEIKRQKQWTRNYEKEGHQYHIMICYYEFGITDSTLNFPTSLLKLISHRFILQYELVRRQTGHYKQKDNKLLQDYLHVSEG